MALQVVKEMETGVQGAYWKIQQVVIKGDEYSRCVIQLYKDQEARAADKQSLETLSLVWKDEENPCTVAALEVEGANPVKLAYAKIKLLPEFAEALDV